MELLQPLRVVHIGLPARHVLHVARVHQQHFKAACFEDLEDRNPVHAGRLHRDRLDTDAAEPIRHFVQIAAEAPECTNGLFVLIATHRHDVKRRPDIQPSGVLIDRNHLPRRSSVCLLPLFWHQSTSVGEAESRGGGKDQFPKRDRLDDVTNIKSASRPQTMFFYGFAEHQKAGGHSFRLPMVCTQGVSRRAGGRPGRTRLFF